MCIKTGVQTKIDKNQLQLDENSTSEGVIRRPSPY